MDKKGLIQGYVVLKHNGKVVYDDYNTITTKGRQFILSTFLANALQTIPEFESSDSEFLNKEEGEGTITELYKLSGIGFGIGTGDTGAAYVVVNDYAFSLADTDHIPTTKVDFNGSFLKYSMNVKATDTMNVAVSELGLYLTPSSVKANDVPKAITDNNAILFSRISFDPIPMVPSTELSLDYYIYF